MRQLLASVLIASSLLLSACIGGDTSESSELNLLPGGPGVRDFYSTMTDLEVEVAYEPGAEPNTGNSSKGYAYWSILEKNLIAAFSKREKKPTVSVPKSLSAMRAIPAQSKPSWTAQEILDLSYQYRKGGSSYTTGNFWIVFLNDLGFVHVAGKTGTAQLGFHNEWYNSWAVGFFPSEHPKYVYVVVMEKGPAGNLTGGIYAVHQALSELHAAAPEYFE
jgi:hypothetical protein